MKYAAIAISAVLVLVACASVNGAPADPAAAAFKAASEDRPVAERAFRDRLSNGTDGPVMVALPAGTFTMGAPQEEVNRFDREGPQREVTIGYQVAIGKYEVTFEEWDACVADGGCADRLDDAGWGRGRLPLTNVSWEDAQQYVSWLSTRTGRTYRLPSEAEWEYAARAGTRTAFSFGETLSTAQANYNGTYAYGSGQPGENRQRTTPVGTFPANAFGLHDMHGNVREWVEDCWNESYADAPSDGSAWLSGDCSFHAYRGGSWNNHPGALRSANRYRNTPDYRFNYLGFRVVRTP